MFEGPNLETKGETSRESFFNREFSLINLAKSKTAKIMAILGIMMSLMGNALEHKTALDEIAGKNKKEMDKLLPEYGAIIGMRKILDEIKKGEMSQEDMEGTIEKYKEEFDILLSGV